ncbi:unnamed protein product [Thelazia callipaeda]|uniref:Transmembrane protein n=1 Tax=Thelazia callipaeda TaxID=103827 RepID=A0A0N5CWH0_THECL|nr:unnamed protein product [Thelazia callipaeda]
MKVSNSRGKDEYSYPACEGVIHLSGRRHLSNNFVFRSFEYCSFLCFVCVSDMRVIDEGNECTCSNVRLFVDKDWYGSEGRLDDGWKVSTGVFGKEIGLHSGVSDSVLSPKAINQASLVLLLLLVSRVLIPL